MGKEINAKMDIKTLTQDWFAASNTYHTLLEKVS